MAKGKSAKGGGGNSHDRAMATAKARKENTPPPANDQGPKIESYSSSEPRGEAKQDYWFIRFLRGVGLSGIAVIFVGVEMISTFPRIGIAITYLGLVLLSLEICFDPLFRKWWLRTSALTLIFVLGAWFSWYMFHAETPEIDAHLLGGYPQGYKVSGITSDITWRSSFGEFKVYFHNPSDEGYKDVSLLIMPDAWIYDQILTDGPRNCDLKPEPKNNSMRVTNRENSSEDLNNTVTVTRVYGALEVHDNEGNVWDQIATQGTYRLHCDSLEPNETVVALFAAVSLNDFGKKLLTPGRMTISTIANPNEPKTTIEDIIGDAPTQIVVQIKGTYVSRYLGRAISFQRKINRE